MGKSFLVICLIIFFIGLMHCKKSESEREVLLFSVKGTWELRSVDGGNRIVQNPYLPGNGNIWQFTDSTYKAFVDGDLKDTGTYVLEIGISPNTGEEAYKIVFDANPGHTLFFEATKSRLIIDRGIIVADGVRERYARIPGLP